MVQPKIEFAERPNGIVLPVRAQPGARRAGIVGVHQGALKVAVTTRPERGKANKAIVDRVCAELRLKPSQVRLVSGETSPMKRLLVSGIALAELERRVAMALPEEVGGE